MTEDIERNVLIAAPIGKVWRAMTDPEIIAEWMSDDSVQISLKIGGTYRFFNGETTGAFMQVDKPKSLAYTWRQVDWLKEWPDSIVQWEFEPVGRSTRITLLHSRLPNKEQRDSHDEGWDLYFLEPLQEFLENEG
ncbi:MAG TPA: SRPBCC domain-containing protein [Aggregatilineales bacterium]|nr:SRPBCC domain-containing protein [Aggregatilineales bacterium]